MSEKETHKQHQQQQQTQQKKETLEMIEKFQTKRVFVGDSAEKIKNNKK